MQYGREKFAIFEQNSSSRKSYKRDIVIIYRTMSLSTLNGL